MSDRPLPRWILPSIIAAYAVLTLLLIARVPLGKAPDEAPHILYVQNLVERHALPIFKPESALSNPGYEFHQPPLYYAVCAVAWPLLGAGVQDYWCRVVSLLFGMGTLFLLWHAVQLLYPQRRELTVLATGFVALWPLHQAVGAAAGNDAAMGFVAAAIFHRIALAARQGWQTRHAIWLGVWVGLGLLTKNTGLVLAFIGVAAAWHLARGEDETGRAGPVAGLTVLGIALLVGGWWLVRNQMLYGDPLVLGYFNQAFGNDPSAQLAAAAKAGLMPVGSYLEALLYVLFCTLWGIFGGPNTALDMFNPFSGRMNPTASSGLVALAVCVVVTAAVKYNFYAAVRRGTGADPQVRPALTWWLIGTIVVTLAWVQFNQTYFQAQARYFHPALLPMGLGFALGWSRIWSALGPRTLAIVSGLFGALLVGITLWNVFVWQTLV